METDIPYHELEDDPFCEAEFRRRNLSILSLKIGIKTVDRAQASRQWTGLRHPEYLGSLC